MEGTKDPPLPTQGGSLLGKGSVEIGDLIVSCGHKVGGWLLAGGCQAQDPGPSWRGVFGGPAVVMHAACLPTWTWCFLFPPLRGATPPPMEQMEGCQTYPQLSHRHPIR
jgi:hypothetical protein